MSSAERHLVKLISQLGEAFETISAAVDCPETKEFAADCAKVCKRTATTSEEMFAHRRLFESGGL